MVFRIWKVNAARSTCSHMSNGAQEELFRKHQMPKVTINVVSRAGAHLQIAAELGRPLMEALRDEGLVEALCGGQAACATCHVHVAEEWMSRVGHPGGQESDMLYSSLERLPNSRLSCQIVASKELEGLSLTIAPSEG